MSDPASRAEREALARQASQTGPQPQQSQPQIIDAHEAREREETARRRVQELAQTGPPAPDSPEGQALQTQQKVMEVAQTGPPAPDSPEGQALQESSQSSKAPPRQPGGTRRREVDVEKIVQSVSDTATASADKLQAEAFEAKAEGKTVVGLRKMTQAQLVRASGGFVQGVTAPIRPQAYIDTARGAYALATNPEARTQAVQSFRARPAESIAEMGGGLLGGMAFGYGAERVIKAVKGPQVTVDKFRRARTRSSKTVRGRKAIMRESFEELPGTRMAGSVDDFSLDMYRVQGDGKWPASGKTGLGKTLGATGGETAQLMVPPGTATRPVYGLVRKRFLERTSKVRRAGPGPLYKYSRTVTPATAPPIMAPSGLLGATSTGPTLGEMSQESLRQEVMTEPTASDYRELSQAQEYVGPDTGIKQPTREDVILGGFQPMAPQPVEEIWEPTPGPVPPIPITVTRPRPPEPILDIPEEPFPQEPLPPTPTIIRRPPPEDPRIKLRFKMDTLPGTRRGGLFGYRLKSGLKKFNVLEAEELV